MLNQVYLPRTGKFCVFWFLFPNSVVLCAGAYVILYWCLMTKDQKSILPTWYYSVISRVFTLVVIVGPWFLTAPVLLLISLELMHCHFSRLWPPWLSEEMKISPLHHVPELPLEQGAHSGQSIEEMNSSSGSCAKDLVVSWFLFLEAVHSCGNSEDILCFVRFTWTSDQYFQLCIIKVVLPACFTRELFVPDNLAVFQPVLPAIWNTAAFWLLKYCNPCFLLFSQILNPD